MLQLNPRNLQPSTRDLALLSRINCNNYSRIIIPRYFTPPSISLIGIAITDLEKKREKLESENAQLRELMGLPKSGTIPNSSDNKKDSFSLPGQ